MATREKTVHVGELITRAQLVLRVSQTGLGKIIGGARGRISRLQRQSAPTLIPHELRALVAALLPRDRALAEEIARAHGESAASLGLAQPAPSTSVAVSPSVPRALLVDAVVCAAADALQAPPSTLRPALRAAFERAKAMNLSLDDLCAALGS